MRKILLAQFLICQIVVSSFSALAADLVEKPVFSSQGQEESQNIVEVGAIELDKGNFSEALKSFRRAASQGDAEGQAALGLMYAFGIGVQNDCSAALSLFRDAIAKGSSGAQYNIGVMHSKGVCVEKSDREAIEWYAKAAKNKNSAAMYSLGNRYVNGFGVLKNEAEGLRLIRAAAEQGFAPAQVNIGVRHVHGIGVPKDMALAGKLFRMAAKQGDASGQAAVGAIYAAFETPEDNVQAYMWASLAAAQGYSKAKELLGLLASRMTPAQKTEALKRARDWRPVSTQRVIAEAHLVDAPATKANELHQGGDPKLTGSVASLSPDGPAVLAGEGGARMLQQVAEGDAYRVEKGQRTELGASQKGMDLSTGGSLLAEMSGLQQEYIPRKPKEEEMGFWEAAIGQQKQNLIPKAWNWATREKPPIDVNWKNPAMDDQEIPPQFISNFAEASSQEEYDQIKAHLKDELEWSRKVGNAKGLGRLGVLASRILDPAVIMVCSLGLMVYSSISRWWLSKKQGQRIPRNMQPLAQMCSGEKSSNRIAWARFLGGAKSGLGVVGACGLFLLGIAQLFVGYVGVEHELGTFWAMAAVVAAIVFRFSLPLTIGSFFGAMNVWGWHWFASALFALPGLAFVIPGVIASMISSLRGNDA